MSTIPKIYRLGDRHTQGILEGHVVIEEKYDGSQFSFSQTIDARGTKILKCWSKNTEIDLDDPGMFKQAVDTATHLFAEGLLHDDWTYQCEFIQKPKHNVLTYSRVPAGNLVLFDIRNSIGEYASPTAKDAETLILGLEPALRFEHGTVTPTQEWVAIFLDRTSSLGGCKVEGIVIKNYGRVHDEREGHPQTAKIVSDAFKEVKTKQCAHIGEGKAAQNEAIERVMYRFRTEARWCKAVQHLREQGKLTDSPKDIGLLIPEVWNDLIAEEHEELMKALFEGFLRPMRVAMTKGFPEWYLAKLEHGWTVFEQDELMKKSPASDAGTGNAKASEVSDNAPCEGASAGQLKPAIQYALDQLRGPYEPEECA